MLSIPMRVAICLFLLFLAGCTSTRQRAAVDSKTLTPGDSLVVVVTNRECPPIRDVVDACGDISMPYVGKLRIAGKTLLQTAETIESAYRPSCGLFRDPIKVSVSLLE